jgi:hypothetical protein
VAFSKRLVHLVLPIELFFGDEKQHYLKEIYAGVELYTK